jgi:hypothetical protein
MKTKKTMRALATIAAGLMMIFSTALPFKAVADNPSAKKFHADTIYSVSGTITQRDIYTYDCKLLMSQLNQRLTQGEWTDYQLTEYTYDGNGWLQTKFITPVGTLESLYTYAYDGDGKMLTELFQRRNLGTTIWEDYEIRYFTYDGNDYLIQDLKQRVVSGSWRNNMLTTNTYDLNGNMLTQLIQNWNNTSMTWTNTALQTNTYDANNNRVSRLDQFYYGGTWINQSLNIHTYDENGNPLTGLFQTWPWMGVQWNNSMFQTWIRGLDGNLILYNVDRWVSGQWANYQKSSYEYLPGFISSEGYVWNATLQEWVPGNAIIHLQLVVDGKQINFGNPMGSYAHVHYSQELYVEPSPYQTVYLGYPPAECVEVSATVSGGTPPYTYAWDNGETGESFMACPEESTTYTVMVTDDEGCTFEASTRVCVIDVRCGKNLDKVALCHCPPGNSNNCKTLCISMEDVAEHLAHGDLLGPCGTDHTCTDYKITPVAFIDVEEEGEIFLRAFPNPVKGTTTIAYSITEPGIVTISLADFTGRTIKMLYEGFAEEGITHLEGINLGDMPPGMYHCILKQADGRTIAYKLILF